MKNEDLGHSEAQESSTMITFGTKLKHLRQKNHLTQKELFTVPVLSEPWEYEAAEYWRYELGAELD